MAKKKSNKANKSASKVVSTVSRTSVDPEIQHRYKELIFGRQNYIWMGIGFGLIVLGMLLMTGGAMPDPNVWDDSIIYSFRRITLAPILILIGLGIEIFAIFR